MAYKSLPIRVDGAQPPGLYRKGGVWSKQISAAFRPGSPKDVLKQMLTNFVEALFRPHPTLARCARHFSPLPVG